MSNPLPQGEGGTFQLSGYPSAFVTWPPCLYPRLPCPLPNLRTYLLPTPVPAKAMLVGLENRIDAQNFEMGVLNVERTEMRKVRGRAVRQGTSILASLNEAGQPYVNTAWVRPSGHAVGMA